MVDILVTKLLLWMLHGLHDCSGMLMQTHLSIVFCPCCAIIRLSSLWIDCYKSKRENDTNYSMLLLDRTLAIQYIQITTGKKKQPNTLPGVDTFKTQQPCI